MERPPAIQSLPAGEAHTHGASGSHGVLAVRNRYRVGVVTRDRAGCPLMATCNSSVMAPGTTFIEGGRLGYGRISPVSGGHRDGLGATSRVASGLPLATGPARTSPQCAFQGKAADDAQAVV